MRLYRDREFSRPERDERLADDLRNWLGVRESIHGQQLDRRYDTRLAAAIPIQALASDHDVAPPRR